MIRRFLCLAAVPFVAAIFPAFAQQPGDATATPTPTPTPDAQDDTPTETNFDTITYWKADLPGGTYVVAHDSINAVSSQEYLLDGAARVTEVNVSTSGVFQPRFYFIEAVNLPGGVGEAATRAFDAAQAAAQRIIPGDAIWSKVVKEYPTTTHAGTVEYRLESKAQLQALYQSLEQSWIQGRSEVFSPGGTSKFATKKESDAEDEESSEGNEETVNDSITPAF